MKYKLNPFTHLAVIFATILLTFGFLATPANAACAPAHVVQPGENLFRVGLKYGVSWTVLQAINNISNPNVIYVGQIICLPGSTGPVVTPPVPPAGGVYYPPPGVYPRINLSTYRAAVGDTITITGVQFPGNAVVDVFITPRGAPYPPTASAEATTAADGTLNFNFRIPDVVAGVPLRGASFSVLVRARATGFYGFNFFINARP